MTTRKYDSPRRTNSAAATRETILRNAQKLFLARGYTGVTIGEIAEAATVAVPTVYSSVGNKPSILTALLEPILVGPSIADAVVALEANDDPHTVIDLIAEGTRLIHERHWDLLYGLLYRKPPGESAVKEVLDRGADVYLQALTRATDRLLALGALRADVPRAEAIDLLWFYLGPQAWMTLVGDRGWSFDRAQTWATRSARQALLKDS
ncbi:TetR/AcrR family transcriptional regulator [Streptomyces sp. NPDC086077]|uniref:TetR/AcrR family transcriptional regulator n=1 Tax=Streptomyces sp. NPDC086077 TaxID=3154862 RepID=UPI003437EEBF